jgi:S1-C subfamily serine protease
MAAMGFLIAGLLLLTGGSRPATQQTAQLTFTPHPSLLAHFASTGRDDGSRGARITSFFGNEAGDSPFKVGDVIVGCGHAPIGNAAALVTCLHHHCIDEQVEFEVVRKMQIHLLKVKLESGP